MIKNDSKRQIGSESFSSYDKASERRPVGGEHASVSGKDRKSSLGLSNSHIKPFSYSDVQITYFTNGKLIKIERKKSIRYKYKPKCTAKRGSIRTFSYKSRARMMNLLAKLDRFDLPLFITLTYPKEYPSFLEAKKSHLTAFIKRLKRRWPSVGYIWKVEPQKRGAPHFHLFLWGIPFKQARANISTLWYEVVKSGDEKHLLAGTQVQKIESQNGVMKYASKYLGKHVDIPEGLGRVWGYGGQLPITDGESFRVTRKQAYILLRRLRRYIKAKGRKVNKGLRSFYVGDPSRWLQVHEALTGDKIPF